ncbi:hypothetical protein EG329_006582 [Mollisiaceae sp. DMI_Dod_QoI]|nr:hypothetical protein EG329_006582 [Helotiales sp. DMI_Dod_QoI]
MYRKRTSRIGRNMRREAHQQTFELQEFPKSSPHSQIIVPPARSKVKTDVGQQKPNLGEFSRDHSNKRPPSIDLSQCRHVIPIEEDSHFEPVMTSAVSDNGMHVLREGDIQPSEEELTEERMGVGLDAMTTNEREISNSEDIARLLNQTTIQFRLNSLQIVVAQVLGILGEVPHITSENIEERSKTSILAKGLATFQLVWFTLKMIIQVSRGYTLSLLELASLTYVFCALVSYALFWSKPQGVESSIEHIVPISPTVRSVTDQDIVYLRDFGGSPFLIRNFVPPFGMDFQGHEPTKHIPTDTSLTVFAMFGPKGIFFYDSDFSGVVTGMIFGGLYCLCLGSDKSADLVTKEPIEKVESC